MESQSKTQRIELIDDIRGICVIYIVAFHAFYDLVYMYGVNVPLYDSWLNQKVLQPTSAGLFILIAGIVSSYSKNNFKRGIKVFGLGLLLWIGTEIIMPSFPIRFGVLSLLGSGMLIYALLEKINPDLFSMKRGKKIPAIAAVVLFLLFVFTYRVQSGYLGIFNIRLIKLPDFLYGTSFLFPIGLPGASFSSSDYYPLIPWVFLFFTGANLGIYFKAGLMPKFFYKSRSKVLRWIGLHALEIYLIHQPFFLALFWVIFNVIPK